MIFFIYSSKHKHVCTKNPLSKISSAQLDSIAVNYTSKCDLVRTHAENTDKSETNTLAAYIVLSVDDFATRHTNTSYRSLDFLQNYSSHILQTTLCDDVWVLHKWERKNTHRFKHGPWIDFIYKFRIFYNEICDKDSNYSSAPLLTLKLCIIVAFFIALKCTRILSGYALSYI